MAVKYLGEHIEVVVVPCRATAEVKSVDIFKGI
jgi:hypothetical protein